MRECCYFRLAFLLCRPLGGQGAVQCLPHMLHSTERLIVLPYARVGNCEIQFLRAYLLAHLAEQLQLGGEVPAEPQGVKQQTKH